MLPDSSKPVSDKTRTVQSDVSRIVKLRFVLVAICWGLGALLSLSLLLQATSDMLATIMDVVRQMRLICVFL